MPQVTLTATPTPPTGLDPERKTTSTPDSY